VAADEVSMAIGKSGQNIKLASRMSGYEIDVYRDIRDDEEDVEIEEFRDVLPEAVIERLKAIGCDTAKAVLELSADELARRAELERDDAQKIIRLMEAEFAEGDDATAA
jgi:N utilization substance protein A